MFLRKKCLWLSTYFSILQLHSPLEYKCWSSFELTWIPFTEQYFVWILDECCSTVLEKSYENSRFAHFNTNSFALISESYAFFRESYAFIRESLALIRERFALIREKYIFSLQKCAHCAFKVDRFYKLYWTITLTTIFCIIYC